MQFALEHALFIQKVVNSQSKLKELVLREMKEEDSLYTIGGRRLRMIALAQDFIGLKIHYRQMDQETILDNCPVCNSALRKSLNKTLEGGRTVTGVKCLVCPYSSGLKLRIPARYVFMYKAPKD